MSSPLRAIFRLTLYLSLTFTLLPLQVIALRFSRKLSVKLPIFYHRLCTRILGFQVRTHGKYEVDEPTLFACNHTSYTDITILGSLLPASFIAKSEVGSWPLFGLLAKLQRTVFVDRLASRASLQREQMTGRLEAGESLIFFPEGTSSDGNVVLPFKSALFSVAQAQPNGKPVVVRPVSVAYTRLDGMPVGRALRPYVAWYGDMTLAPHLWEIAGLGRITVDVIFHPTATLSDLGSRKALASHCHKLVARGVAFANAGRIDRLKEFSRS